MRVPSSRVWLVGVPLTFAVVHHSDEAGAAVRCAPIPGVAVDVGQACVEVDGDFLSRLERLGVDVFIPDPQPNPWWTGDLHAYVACPGAGLYNSWIGRQSLTNLYVGEFNHLSFPLTIEMQNALASGAECHLEFALNANGDSDGFLFDRVGFE